MQRERPGWKPAAAKASRASRWSPGWTSTVVSTPSARMPRSRQIPDTPAPVPISTTALASSAAASSWRAAPLPGETGRTVASSDWARACSNTSSSAA